jgi:lysophospholipase L1-like esterase
MSQITYPDKVTGDEFTGDEATEIKTVVNNNDTETRSSLSGFKANTIVIFGDSITEQNNSVAGLNNHIEAKGYFSWGNFFLNQRFNVIYNAGIGGNTTTQMLARIDADVIAKNPKYCFIMGGINDITAGETDYSVIASRLEEMYIKLTKAGITIIASTVTPAATIDTRISTTNYLNEWIRQYSINNNIILVNMAEAIINSANSEAIAGLIDAGSSHPTTTGAFLMGKKIYEVLDSLIKPIPNLAISNIDPNVLNDNPMLLGDNAGVADDWAADASFTVSKEIRENGKGEWQVIEDVRSGTSKPFIASNVVSSGFAVGDKIFGLAEIEVESTAMRYIFLDMFFLNSSFATISQNTCLHQLEGDEDVDGGNFSGVLKTQAIEAPVGTAYLRIAMRIDLTGTLKIGRVQINKELE